MNSNILNDLSIVVPTYSRPHELRKTVNFFQDIGVRLLIVDGSEDPLPLSAVQAMQRSVTYVHSTESFQSRLMLAAELVETDFVTLLADDDIHMPSGLARSVVELRQDRQLASCMGWALGFTTRGIAMAPPSVVGLPIYSSIAGRAIINDEAGDRLMAHFSDYVPAHLYSVMPTRVFQNSVRMINLPGDRTYGQFEIEFEAAVLFQGKSRILPHLHWLRHVGSAETHKRDPDMNRRETHFYQRFLDPGGQDWVSEFLTSRANFLANVCDIPQQTAKTWLDAALTMYSRKCAGRSNPKRSLKSLLDAQLGSWPHGLQKALRTVYLASGLASPKLNAQQLARSLSEIGMAYQISELEDVIARRILASPPS